MRPPVAKQMMHGGMGPLWLLPVILLALGTAALVKHLRSGPRSGWSDERGIVEMADAGTTG